MSFVPNERKAEAKHLWGFVSIVSCLKSVIISGYGIVIILIFLPMDFPEKYMINKHSEGHSSCLKHPLCGFQNHPDFGRRFACFISLLQLLEFSWRLHRYTVFLALNVTQVMLSSAVQLPPKAICSLFQPSQVLIWLHLTVQPLKFLYSCFPQLYLALYQI